MQLLTGSPIIHMDATCSHHDVALLRRYRFAEETAWLVTNDSHVEVLLEVSG